MMFYFRLFLVFSFCLSVGNHENLMSLVNVKIVAILFRYFFFVQTPISYRKKAGIANEDDCEYCRRLYDDIVLPQSSPTGFATRLILDSTLISATDGLQFT